MNAGVSANSGSSYAYRAARADGVLEFGVVQAPSREAASALLVGERGLFPIEIRLDGGSSVTDAGAGKRVRVSAGDLALGLRVLATLLEAGLPMGRALAAFSDLAPDSWREGLAGIAQAVREGHGLAGALQHSTLDLPPVVIGLLRAGEAGSGIAPAVRRAAELTEQAAAVRSALRSALAYPLILAGAGVGSIALLVGVVLPRFAAILADLGQALPTSTRVVLGAADAARALAAPALVVVALLLVLWRAWTGTAEGRRMWHEWLLRVPAVGRIRRGAAVARGAAALGSLLDSGVPIAPALAHAARATGDEALSARLLRARELVITGERVSRAVEREDALTATTVRLVRAGEETGRLGPMLHHAARLESERAEQAVKAAVRLLEPALIVAFGAVVAFVAAALLQAVYSVRPVA